MARAIKTAQKLNKSPVFSRAERYRAMTDKTKTLERLLTEKPEPLQEETQENPQDIKIVWGTSGEYPDGAKWERDATTEEEAEYNSWAG